MAQTDKNAEDGTSNERPNIMEAIINFLKLFMPETLVKRGLSIVLISAGLENARVTELTGYCDRSVAACGKRWQEGTFLGSLQSAVAAGRAKLQASKRKSLPNRKRTTTTQGSR